MKKYCSECKLPLAYPAAVTCDKCGKPTRPMDIFERVAIDGFLPLKDKKQFRLIGVMNIAACVISMLWELLMLAVAARFGGDLSDGSPMPNFFSFKFWVFLFLVVRYKILGFFGGVIIVWQIGTLFFSVMILLKKAWAVQICRELYFVNAVVYFVLGNPIGFALGLCIAVKLDGFFSKMEAARNTINAAPECKSCGKRKE